MTDRPIIFSAPMVRALIEGRKTQTRRILKPQPAVVDQDGCWYGNACFCLSLQDRIPYKIGDRLWVRENVTAHERASDGRDGVVYAADGTFIGIPDTAEAADRWVVMNHYGNGRGKMVPSIHMPRWASRMTLLVTGVKVERLQNISEEDAKAEGVQVSEHLPADVHRAFVPLGDGEVISGYDCREAFAGLWHSINGPGAWDANPWVGALTFTVHRGNIDAMRAA